MLTHNEKIEFYQKKIERYTQKLEEAKRKQHISELTEYYLDPVLFIETFIKIFSSEKNAIIPFKLNDFQKQWLHDITHNRFNDIYKGRQQGFTTLMKAYVVWRLFTSSRQENIFIVTPRLEMSYDFLEGVLKMINDLPPKIGEFLSYKIERPSRKIVSFRNSSKLIVHSIATPMRGITPTVFIWDEMQKDYENDRFWTGARPTLQTGAISIISHS